MSNIYTGPVLGIRSANDAMPLGTWWWDLDLLARPDKETGLTAQVAFDMLLKEHINEIYLSADPANMPPWGSRPPEGKATLEQMAAFIRRCTKQGIAVTALLGWGGKAATATFAGGRGYPEITNYIEGVAAYNRAVEVDQRFRGVHLDIEPDLSDDPVGYRTEMRQFLLYTRALCDRHHFLLQFDINAWLDDSQIAQDENGNSVLMADLFTQTCDSLNIMAYRANAGDQLELSGYMAEAARRNHCLLNVGCETDAPEKLGKEAFITYSNFTPAYMASEQKKLRTAFEKKHLPAGFGLSVHWVNAWFAMMKPYCIGV